MLTTIFEEMRDRPETTTWQTAKKFYSYGKREFYKGWFNRIIQIIKISIYFFIYYYFFISFFLFLYLLNYLLIINSRH